jgi:hypothetical protein
VQTGPPALLPQHLAVHCAGEAWCRTRRLKRCKFCVLMKCIRLLGTRIRYVPVRVH